MEERSSSKRSKSRHGASSAKDGTFASLGLEPRLLRALNHLGFKQPTPVQSRCIPVALEGRDLIALAPTGSGKTLGYLLPTLHRVLTSASGPGPSWQALVLVPTRELCEQVAGVGAQVCRAAGDAVRTTPLTAATSESMMAELGEVVVTTPARLLAALGADPGLERALQSRLTTLVVDEADLLMAFGHDRDLAAIAPRVPRAAQSMLFSATSSPDVEAAEKLVLHSPARLDVRDAGKAGGARGGEGPMAGTASSIVHHVLRLPRSCAQQESRSMCERMLHLLVLLQHGLLPRRTLVFVNGADDAVRLRLFFGAFGLRAAAVHSQLPLNSRSHILQEFNAGLIQVLVATDGAGSAARAVQDQDAEADAKADAKAERRIEREAHAEAHAEGGKARGRRGFKAGTPGEEFGVTRGIDFKGVSSVVNLTVPPAVDSYVHRVGRTGRGGETGMALTLVGPGDADFEVALERCLALAQPAGAEAGREADAKVAALAKPSNFGVLGLQRFEALPQKSIKALRYRAEDVFRSLTRNVVREARVQELKQEMLNSERLASFFEEHPQDLQLLKHDRPLVSTKASAASAKHVKHVPTYMADAVGTAGARTQAAAIAARAAKRPRAGSVDPLKKLSKKVAKIRDKPTEMELKADAYGKKVAQKKVREEAKNRRLAQQHAERNKRTKK